MGVIDQIKNGITTKGAWFVLLAVMVVVMAIFIAILWGQEPKERDKGLLWAFLGLSVVATLLSRLMMPYGNDRTWLNFSTFLVVALCVVVPIVLLTVDVGSSLLVVPGILVLVHILYVANAVNRLKQFNTAAGVFTAAVGLVKGIGETPDDITLQKLRRVIGQVQGLVNQYKTFINATTTAPFQPVHAGAAAGGTNTDLMTRELYFMNNCDQLTVVYLAAGAAAQPNLYAVNKFHDITDEIKKMLMYLGQITTIPNHASYLLLGAVAMNLDEIGNYLNQNPTVMALDLQRNFPTNQVNGNTERNAGELELPGRKIPKSADIMKSLKTWRTDAIDWISELESGPIWYEYPKGELQNPVYKAYLQWNSAGGAGGGPAANNRYLVTLKLNPTTGHYDDEYENYGSRNYDAKSRWALTLAPSDDGRQIAQRVYERFYALITNNTYIPNQLDSCCWSKCMELYARFSSNGDSSWNNRS
jgi:hypothetical protein